MEKTRILALSCLAAWIWLASCGGKKSGAGTEVEMLHRGISETYVDTMTLRLSSFNKQTVCNGRLRARTKSELSFSIQGVTAEIYVEEGMHLQKGALIATLDMRDRLRELERAEKELEKAEIAYVDKLIGMGYDAQAKNVPEDVRKRVEVTSGYYSAQYQLQSARKAIDDSKLYAPFNGRVANMEARPFQSNSKICTLIDDSQFDVEFKILEAEYANVKKGQHIKVLPYARDDLSFEGTVAEINPLVDDKGQIKVIARLNNRNSELIEGMNVRIVIEEEVKGMFVVPKDAVVERDGYHVVFIYRDGKAVWTYVDVLLSNISSFAIRGCQSKKTIIQEGDVIITSGNMNLADGTEVKISGQK